MPDENTTGPITAEYLRAAGLLDEPPVPEPGPPPKYPPRVGNTSELVAHCRWRFWRMAEPLPGNPAAGIIPDVFLRARDALPQVEPLGIRGGLSLARVTFEGREWIEASWIGGAP